MSPAAHCGALNILCICCRPLWRPTHDEEMRGTTRLVFSASNDLSLVLMLIFVSLKGSFAKGNPSFDPAANERSMAPLKSQFLLSERCKADPQNKESRNAHDMFDRTVLTSSALLQFGTAYVARKRSLLIYNESAANQQETKAKAAQQSQGWRSSIGSWIHETLWKLSLLDA